MSFVDPGVLERQVEEAVKAYRKWRRLLRTDVQLARRNEPLASRRAISTRVALQQTFEMPDGLPAKDSLVGWIRAMTIERVTVEDMLEAEAARRDPTHEVRALSKGRQWQVRELVLEAVLGQPPDRRVIAAEGVTRRADDASSNALWWGARRSEAARQLGVGSLWEIEAPVRAVQPMVLVEAVLSQTDDLARDQLGSGIPWQEVLAAGTAADALDGWPARLSQRWLEDTVGTLVGPFRPELGTLPETRCGASFARALARLGAASRRAMAAHQPVPFVLAEHAFDAAPASHGALFSSLLMNVGFQRRRLGLGPVRAQEQARAFARCFLVWLRLTAVQVAVGYASSPAEAREAQSIVGSRALGTALPLDLAGVLPRYQPEAASQLVGMLDAAQRYERLREVADEDWFDNPRGQESILEIDLSRRLVLDVEAVKVNAQLAARLLGELFG